MPWEECKPMDGRLRFVARLLDGETMEQNAKGQEQALKSYQLWSTYTAAE